MVTPRGDQDKGRDEPIAVRHQPPVPGGDEFLTGNGNTPKQLDATKVVPSVPASVSASAPVTLRKGQPDSLYH